VTAFGVLAIQRRSGIGKDKREGGESSEVRPLGH
jgi:hypothetical protein